MLVQSNFGARPELSILGVAVGRHFRDTGPAAALRRPETGSIIVLIATDAPLSPLQLQRVARRGALGIGRTGTSGGHYSGDLMLAFSTANGIDLAPIGAPPPYAWRHEYLNDAHCDLVYEATVDATEEAILNALLAAESVPTLLPRGYTLEAIDHGELMALLRAHGRVP